MNFNDILNGAFLLIVTLSAENLIDMALLSYYALIGLGVMFIVDGLMDSSPEKIKRMEQEISMFRTEIRELKLVAANSHRTLRGTNIHQQNQSFTPQPIVRTTGKICTICSLEHSESYVRCTNCGGILQR